VRELLLARHAFAGSNRDVVASSLAPGEGLTPEGVEQARALREALAREPVALGVSTGFARTDETLALALEGRDVHRIVVPELGEIGFGEYDGGLLETYRVWAAAESPSVAAPGGGESRGDAATRFARGLRILLARPEETVLAVAHALAVRYVLDAAEGLVPAARIAPVEHAVAHRLTTAEAEAAATLLVEWGRDPAFRRDPSVEGRARR
jgi:broad specificity phosphatase PhoE